MLIATRILTYRTAAVDKPMEIRIYAPEPGDKDFSCRYEIDWPDGLRLKQAYGIDAVQAIELAMQMIGAELYCSSYHKLGQLVFEAAGAGYGFPVPYTARDLLVGDDAKFF